MRRLPFLSLSVLLAALGLLAFTRIISGEVGERPEEPPPPDPTRVHPELLRLLEEAGPAQLFPVILEWRRGPGLKLEEMAPSDTAGRMARRFQVVAALQADAQRQSAALQDVLQEAARRGLASQVRAFWASPVIAARASPAVISSLSLRDDVVQVRLDEQLKLEIAPEFTLEEKPLQPESARRAPPVYPWNLEMINVRQAYQALGLDGTGVVVANLDTGVDWQHPALLEKYRGYNPKGPSVHAGNWYVATTEPYNYPGDGNGHGTHTMGIMVGDDGGENRIGVAPGAQWIAVKVFNNQGITYESWIHDAFQWILAPDGDPALAPDIVNNSWSSPASADDRYRPDIAALRAAGILPVFAAGNKGPNSATIGSPASYPESLAAGAVDEEKAVTTFSSRGPSPWNETKPEVVAPGARVRSAFPGGGYATGSGTSIAAPHVAGLAALLLQADPSLTQSSIETILKSTAEPLGTSLPNNDAGWGLVNAYAAGLRVTDSGELAGAVVRPDGGRIAHPTITAARREGGGSTQEVTVAGDADGAFNIALLPGRYDVTARAFGFDPASLNHVEVVTGVQTSVSITLTAKPVGSVFGTITGVETGAPLSATLTLEDTEVKVQSDPNTGAYSIALPEGTWSIRILSAAHRIGHITPTVQAGHGYQFDVTLPPAPKILLVDSGRWYYGSEIGYYEDALAALDYPYQIWPIRNLGEGDTDDRPTTYTLSSYDVTIWSAPLDSPGIIGAGGVITDYLDSGGNFLISGQEVAFLDGLGTVFRFPEEYLNSYLGIRFKTEGNLSDLMGEPGSPLDGLVVALNTPDSARQQAHPDAVWIRDTLLASPALKWSDDNIGGVTAGICRPYRAAWLGFGLEGAGPRPVRIELLGRILEWFSTPPDHYGLLLDTSADPLIGLPGTVVSQTIQVVSRGTLTDTYDLQVDGGPWSIDLALPDGTHTQTGGVTLGGCERATITATIAIPPGLSQEAFSVHTLTFTSRSDSAVRQSATVTAKTPAPVLLVDNQLWYPNLGRYTQALDSLNIAYDVFDTQKDAPVPLTGTFMRYPLVVWVTGYNWFSPLTAVGEERLEAYLDQGGRLLISSQDLLDIRGVSEFARTRLGVEAATLSITSTEVVASPGSPLGPDLGPWTLTYPFTNWSDGLVAGPAAVGTFLDQNMNTAGVVRPGSNWRTAFYAFPVEVLGESALRTLLARTTLWLSPFGDSHLEAPPTAAEGERIPITLTLGAAISGTRSGLRAVLPLPPETALVPGSISGPWSHDAESNSLVWQGSLSTGITISFAADLDLVTGIPDGTVLPLQARLYAGDGLTLTAMAPIQVDASWFTLAAQVEPGETSLNATVQYTLTVANSGPVSAAALLTSTIPTGLELIPGTVSASKGEISVSEQRLNWTGALSSGGRAYITYDAAVKLDRAGARLITRVDLTSPNIRRLAWAVLAVPQRYYFPFLGNRSNIVRNQNPARE